MHAFFKVSMWIMAALSAPWAQAHNNPTFREDLLTSVDIVAGPNPNGPVSAPFAVELPKETVQLIWRVRAKDGAERIRFAVRQGDAGLLTGVAHGVATNPVSGAGLVITGVVGTDQTFVVDVIAKVLDRPQATQADHSQGGDSPGANVNSRLELEGLAVYKKANCMGCHKWHGAGGGGYGGAARSLRASTLDAEALTLVVRCGIPGSGMPYHGRDAYQEDADTSCYGQTRVGFGAMLAPRTTQPLSNQQIEAVVTYVVSKVKGRGDPTFAECEAFWGKNKRQCDEMK